MTYVSLLRGTWKLSGRFRSVSAGAASVTLPSALPSVLPSTFPLRFVDASVSVSFKQTHVTFL